MKKIQLTVFMVLAVSSATVKTMERDEAGERTPLAGTRAALYGAVALSDQMALQNEDDQYIEIAGDGPSVAWQEPVEVQPIAQDEVQDFLPFNEGNLEQDQVMESLKVLQFFILDWKNQYNELQADFKMKVGHFSTHALENVKASIDSIADQLRIADLALIRYPIERLSVKKALDKARLQIQQIHFLLEQGNGGKSWKHKRSEDNMREVNAAIAQLHNTQKEIIDMLTDLNRKHAVSIKQERAKNAVDSFLAEQERFPHSDMLIFQCRNLIRNPDVSAEDRLMLEELAPKIIDRVHEYRMKHDREYADGEYMRKGFEEYGQAWM